MTDQTKNRAAVSLGRRARGKAKQFTPEQIALRTARLAANRAKRWPKPPPAPPPPPPAVNP